MSLSDARRLAALVLVLLAAASARAGDPARVDFNRDIRPILSDACFQCHGPDKGQRKAGLRLDTEAGAFALARGGQRVLVPAKLEESELWLRISAADAAERMPPLKSGKHLSKEQIALLRQWIAQGAPWQAHWSLVPPRRSPLPDVPGGDWVRNPVDAFVLAALRKERLQPAREAAKETLIRRVSLDLTGIPPTPAEVDAFLADASVDAYDKVVDRLLASPRYGERMAARWLDGARYADTNGYQTDGERDMWRWRDWVIDAYNANVPFDRFTVEQLAGDLLPQATLEQRIATGFNRNHRGNAEGGIIPEEYAVEYVVDRVETTATVWMGLTLGCARCHDHKFDPVTQKEFYRVFAYFNNVPEKGRAIKYGNSPPYIAAPTPEMRKKLAALDDDLAAADQALASLAPQFAAAQDAWEKTPDAAKAVAWSPGPRPMVHYPLDGDAKEAVDGKKPAQFAGGAATYDAAPTGKGAVLDGSRFLDAGDVAGFDYLDRFSLAAWVYPSGKADGTLLSRCGNEPDAMGWSVRLVDGKVQVNLVQRWLDDAARVETRRTLEPKRWHHVVVTYDGTRQAAGVTVYVNGRSEKLTTLLDELNQPFRTKDPFRIGAGGGPALNFHGRIADVRAYGERLDAEQAAALAVAEPIAAIVGFPREKRTLEQAVKLRLYYQDRAAPESARLARRKVEELRVARARLIDGFPTTMVMAELPTPRPTFVLRRGEYDKPGEPVTASVPACLPPLPVGAPSNRLGLARWLVGSTHPLTARVAVNRAWQMFFGIGLVKTVDDFGSQGEPPTHPELLDWLATEFVRTGWDVKRLHRTIALSATYRQSSKASRELYQRDPENRFLARGPRFRLSAGTVRDNALAASGLLVEKIGGPSVKPYQPAGLWKELASVTEYKQESGPSLYRRSLYTFWKRTVAPPAMMAFDASGRETCVVRETRTNTPLQALNLLNDVTYVEAARILAQRAMCEKPTPDERLTLAFRLATARRPTPAELAVLRDSLDYHRTAYGKDRAAALKLLAVGESQRDEKLDVAELASYAAVARLILNLDETITKE